MMITKVVIDIDAPTLEASTEVKQRITITEKEITLIRKFHNERNETIKTAVDSKVLEKAVIYLENNFEQVLAMDGGIETISLYNSNKKIKQIYTCSTLGQYEQISKELRRLSNLPNAWFFECMEE